MELMGQGWGGAFTESPGLALSLHPVPWAAAELARDAHSLTQLWTLVLPLGTWTLLYLGSSM